MTQSERVLRYLQAHEAPTAMEITLALHPYVSNVRARVSDSRAAGHIIEARKRADGYVGLYLVQPGQRTLGLDHVA
jgi:hypothetical protein